MNPLLAKEIRLLTPAFAAALVLALFAGAIVPLAFQPSIEVLVLPVWLAASLLALSSFGREFALGTFPLTLAQPQERQRTWWTKTAVLGVATVAVFGVFWLAVDLWAIARPGAVTTYTFEALGVTALSMAMIVGGGLLTTLLLRQAIAAFWFTFWVPAIILALTPSRPAPLIAVSVIFGVAAFVLARRYFLRMQEVGWTGGVVALPGLPRARAAEASVRRRRPWGALFLKELQLHQIGLMGITGLFALHLIVILVRHAEQASLTQNVRYMLESFGALWFLVPLVVSATSVAEERRLGTADGLRTLPFSARAQFAVKLLFVLVIGGLLSPVLLVLAEGIGKSLGLSAQLGGLKLMSGPWVLELLWLVTVALAVVGFYASTLTRNVVQGLGAGVLTAFVLWSAGLFASHPRYFAGGWFETGNYLVCYVGWPVMVTAFLWLAWRNFRQAGEGWRFWRRSVVGVPAAFVLTGLLTSATYHRAWEWFEPLQPSPGPARFTLRNPPKLSAYGGGAITAVLPDGRLWVDCVLNYNHGARLLSFGDQTGFFVGGAWGSLYEDQFLFGANWIAGAANYNAAAGIRSDGTLWVSQRGFPPLPGRRFMPRVPYPGPVAVVVAQIGTARHWKGVAGVYLSQSSRFLLLSVDGSLWWWRRENVFSPSVIGIRRRGRLTRLGKDSDWARVVSLETIAFLWKRDGTAWILYAPWSPPGASGETSLPPFAFSRCPALDNTGWKSIVERPDMDVGVREDGTLWAWTVTLRSAEGQTPSVGNLGRIGRGANWLAVAGRWRMLAALRSDGSLWYWRPIGQAMNQPNWGWKATWTALTQNPPRRLGSRHDWVAICGMMNGVVSVEADGTLWYWWPRDNLAESSQPMLAPSRRPDRIGSLVENGNTAAQK